MLSEHFFSYSVGYFPCRLPIAIAMMFFDPAQSISTFLAPNLVESSGSTNDYEADAPIGEELPHRSDSSQSPRKTTSTQQSESHQTSTRSNPSLIIEGWDKIVFCIVFATIAGIYIALSTRRQ
ncbi:MAG TPA: hypothetical protein V6D50_25325 [Chroococcales cyanobacterium]